VFARRDGARVRNFPDGANIKRHHRHNGSDRGVDRDNEHDRHADHQRCGHHDRHGDYNRGRADDRGGDDRRNDRGRDDLRYDLFHATDVVDADASGIGDRRAAVGSRNMRNTNIFDRVVFRRRCRGGCGPQSGA
jgi:hypothetical protein